MTKIMHAHPKVAVFIVLLLVAAAAFQFHDSNWTPNVVTSAIEIALTVFIVDLILKGAEERRFKLEQDAKLRVFSDLANRYFLSHLQAALIAASPIGQPKLNLEDLKVSDLQNMFNKVSALKLGPYFEMPYVRYFESRNVLTDFLRKSLLELNVTVHQDVVRLLVDFVDRQDQHNLYAAVSERTRSKVGEQLAMDFDKDVMAKFEGPAKFSKMSNTVDIYVQICLDIQDANSTYFTFLRLLRGHGINLIK